MSLHVMLLHVMLLCYVINWGLGIGDWAQSPITNPQYPIMLHLIN